MSASRVASAALLVAAVWSLSAATEVRANGRQYYTSWAYHPQKTYYYRTYYYKPTPVYTGYQYHYCIYTPSAPRYVYYYNPHSQAYWGRFDLEGKPGQQYSLLKDEDRKGSLSEIPETAFPKAAAMPVIPDAADGVQIEPPQGIPEQDLPNSSK